MGGIEHIQRHSHNGSGTPPSNAGVVNLALSDSWGVTEAFQGVYDR